MQQLIRQAAAASVAKATWMNLGSYAQSSLATDDNPVWDRVELAYARYQGLLDGSIVAPELVIKEVGPEQPHYYSVSSVDDTEHECICEMHDDLELEADNLQCFRDMRGW